MADDALTGEPACCDPEARDAAGHHAAGCTSVLGFLDDRTVSLRVACPTPQGCGASAGASCVTPSGYASAPHRVRTVVARGGQAGPVNKGGRPSYTQGDMLGAAIANDGSYPLIPAGFHGAAPVRQAMTAMERKGWFVFRRSGPTEDWYEITEDGRDAHVRYENWYFGRKP